MPTDLQQEQERQKEWQLKPKYQGATWFDALLTNEFSDQGNIETGVNAKLAAIVRLAVEQVPFYIGRLRDLGLQKITFHSAADLAGLPILSKADLQQNYERLQPPRLPPGEEFGGITSSSGTTGRKTHVLNTLTSRRMFGFLKQREYRWWRYDPMGRQFWCRRPEASLRRPGNVLLKTEEVFEVPEWPVLSLYFHTGPCVAVALQNPVDWIADQIAEQEPVTMMSTNARLEHFAYAFRETKPPASLKVAQALTGPVTQTMRGHISESLGIPVYQNYGLNEVGIIASQCAEGLRYHVHVEHCWVEIVDEEGQPVDEGKSGRLLVTALNNTAMPLIRYDTGDIAQASAGPCPCGRNLPGFERIVGRQARLSMLPEGTLDRAQFLLDATANLPSDLSRGLREYQLHQKADGNFELRVVMSEGSEPLFGEHIVKLWTKSAGVDAPDLRIRTVGASQLTPSNKFMHLTSEFITPEDGNWKPELFDVR